MSWLIEQIWVLVFAVPSLASVFAVSDATIARTHVRSRIVINRTVSQLDQPGFPRSANGKRLRRRPSPTVVIAV